MEQFDFQKAFAKRAAKPRLPVYDPSEMPTHVSVDLRASRSHSLLDVQTADYPGLLYRIASAIAETGLNLVSARITTEKGAALDTFYLTDRVGKKIESDEVLGALIEEVRKRIAL
jgi:[protein-PII] uridylyltransferase